MTAPADAGSRASRTPPAAPRVRLVVADGQRLVADGVATMLSSDPHLDVVATLTSGQEVLDRVERLRPHVVLLEVDLEGMDGLAVIGELRGTASPTRSVVASLRDDDRTVALVVQAGAWGYLPKTVTGSELVRAIQTVAAGTKFMHPDVTGPLHERSGRRRPALPELSPREIQVLEKLAAGESTRQIAASLNVREETVKSHLSRIYRKLGANDRVHAVILALRQGLVR